MPQPAALHAARRPLTSCRAASVPVSVATPFASIASKDTLSAYSTSVSTASVPFTATTSASAAKAAAAATTFAPPPPPPAPLTRAERVARLNERFRHGAPSSDLAAAGVLARQFDTLDDPVHPWLPCPADQWCAGFGDRWPASIINAGARHLYYGDGKGGVLIAPTVSIFCAYAEDGNSMDGSKVCNPLGGDGVSCIPGCYPKGQECEDVGHAWMCSFPPSQLKQALQAQQDRADFRERNNEVRRASVRGMLGEIATYRYEAVSPQCLHAACWPFCPRAHM